MILCMKGSFYSSLKNGAEVGDGFVGGFLGAVGVGVEFDGEEAVVLDGGEGGAEFLPVHGAGAGYEVVVFFAGDVFDVAVPDAVFEEFDGGGDVFAGDEAVADVEVGAEEFGAHAVDEFAEFGGPFDEEARLGFDADADFEFFGGVEDGAEGFAELFSGGVGGHGGQGLAGGDGDVFGADGFGELEGGLDHADAVGAVGRVG